MISYQAYQPSGIIVSYFRNIADREPLEIDIARFLRAIERGQFKDYISSIRLARTKDERTKLKKKLPCITTSATFYNGHDLKNFNQLSNLISIDIDNLKEPEALKISLKNDKYVFSCFTSPSGNGLKVIIKISTTPEQFINSFLSLENYFRTYYQVDIDKSCKDLTRLMFISSDEKIYINYDSQIYEHKYYSIKPHVEIPEYFKFISSNHIIEALLLKIEINRIDITSNYADWLKIAYALVSEFGINGMGYFHRFSQFYKGYNSEQCSKQFESCYKSGSRSITIKSLYDLTKQYGISFKN